jgi:hypothetical protein
LEKSVIISASRRTDIPAFYSEWFMYRVRAGYCLVPNPFNTTQASRVSLLPDDVEAIVFWSKNPTPLVSHLDELDQLGFRYYFQFTLNDYPRPLEPRIPPLEARLSLFRNLSQRIGPACVIWRYDPIIISNITPPEFHLDKFAHIAQELRRATNRVVVSLVDFYRKTERRLSQLEKEEGFSFDRHASHLPLTVNLLKALADIARENSMEIFTCAEERDYSQIGIPPGKCIDDEILRRAWLLNPVYRKDPSQRDSCLCMVSKDIGINDTCMHGCPYCYATANYSIAQRRYTEHDSRSPLLWGNPDEVTIIDRKKDPQMKLFW